ncbi:MAG TPA: hypothetical protein VEQ87_09410 [Burkholderiales bacterium]|nr:hypothetical protein [Burkholderiales bacterium]
MATRRILYFTAEDHYLYRSVGGALELEAKFTGDDLGLTAFRDFLRGQRGALFAVVADLAGEDFHEEQIPFVRGADREAVLSRRLAQRYRDTRLAAGLSLGQVAGAERRNERVLLTSFTNTQQLTPWLDALEEAGVRLSGVYSIPLLAPALASRLGVKDTRVLLVTANRAGLRQCYVENGRLRFARLERTVEMVPQALAMFVRSETQRLVQYLVTLRALPRDGSAVQVLVVAPPGERATFEQALASDARLLFRVVDYADAQQVAKLRRAPEGAAAEALFLHLAAHKPPAEQFASREDRRRYFIWQLQRGVVAAGVAGFALCALVGGSRWIEVMSLRGQVEDETHAARTATQQYERITSTFPVTQTSTENLKVTVVEFRRIAERSADPQRTFQHVSRVLEQYPQFELDSLRWGAGRPSELRDAPLKPAAQAAGGSDSLVLVEVSGRVQATQRNDYRGITAQVQRFANSLVGEGYELVRTQLPFDVTSEGILTGDIGGAAESGEAPRFTVTLARRLP